MLRTGLVPSLLGLTVVLGSATAATDRPASVEVAVLRTAAAGAATTLVASGALDSGFEPLGGPGTPVQGGAWLRLRVVAPLTPAGVPALVVRKARGLELQLYAKGSSRAQPLAPAAEQPEFRGAQDVVLILPGDPGSAQTLYAYIDPHGRSLAMPRFSSTTLADALGRGADHARMIALAFGALIAMSLAALVIWFVLADRLFVLYTALFALQALYIAFLSGQGFDWPVLAYARPLASHAWNVPAALGGAVACLFVREIADLQHYSPRVYAAFRWLAVAFVVLAVANVAKLFGFSDLVSGAGNVMFLAATIFTLAVSFLAWRRGIRAAGWFLLAWGLLEGFTIATAARLLMADAEDAERLLYYGLPLSMVAAAVLIALGVADRLRDQRRALTDAERRAQTDPLTGVLNRRSLIERLDAVCLRARTRELPISLLFIDLDHFKEINDSRGHAAGDACLRAIVSPIQAELRQSDVVGRYGGEEFVVILSSADTAAAHPIAERILERVANIRVDGFGPPIRLTCSIGVAGSDALGAWGEQLIAHADAAVYAAKNAGRNRVQVAVPLTA